jgi:hypothetical protein
MKCVLSFVLAVSTLAAPAIGAQGVDGQCSDPAFVGASYEGGDACQKVVDIYRYVSAQLGTLIAGGNAVLGRGGTLGGFPHVTAELRVNAMRASIPDVSGTGIVAGEPRRSTYAVDGKWVAVPQVDASLGIFKGVSVGNTHIGGVDAIVSAAYVPDATRGTLSIASTGDALALGYGARVGIMNESALTPAISFTYLERRLPTTTIAASEGSNTLTVRDLELSARSWRVVASKRFLLLGIAAGIGQDVYHARTTLTYDVDGVRPPRPFTLDASPKRTNMFVDVSVTPFPFARLVGELGRVAGGELRTYNRFESAAGDARLYGSVGLRVGF